VNAMVIVVFSQLKISSFLLWNDCSPRLNCVTYVPVCGSWSAVCHIHR